MNCNVQVWIPRGVLFSTSFNQTTPNQSLNCSGRINSTNIINFHSSDWLFIGEMCSYLKNKVSAGKEVSFFSCIDELSNISDVIGFLLRLYLQQNHSGVTSIVILFLTKLKTSQNTPQQFGEKIRSRYFTRSY